MEDKVMGIGDFRKALSERVEAAAFAKEPTIIEHGKRGVPRAALIPFDWLQELYELRRARQSDLPTSKPAD
jgi:hypothetical protein